MSFSITITADTLALVKAQAADFIGAAAVSNGGEAPKPTKAAKAAKTETPAPTAPDTSSSATPSQEESTGSPGSAESTKDSAPVVTPAVAGASTLEEQVRAILTPLLRDPDQAPKVTALMATFGATKLSKIPADKLPEVLAAAQLL